MRKILLIWMVLIITLVFVWPLDVEAKRKKKKRSQKVSCVERCICGEALYLSDSGFKGDGTTLFRVNLDSITEPKRANLVRLPDAGYGSGVIPFDQVDAIAATPDGKRLYAIDKYGTQNPNGSGKLGYYEVMTHKWVEIGEVKTNGSTTPIPGIVLLAFEPDWTLVAASERTESLYEVKTWNAEAILIGEIINKDTNATVNLTGADIAFGVDGTLYLWANGANPGAPVGLYSLTLPVPIPGTVYATYLGPNGNQFYTGLAIRANGIADIVASGNVDNRIHVLDKSNGNTVATFDMYLDGSPYDHIFGDMSVGPLTLFTYTIGYWKSHSWCGASALICDVPVNKTLGKNILWNASSEDFSMLVAQLIAAKLNTNNSGGIPVIGDAESWLCSQEGIVDDGTLNWYKGFDSETQKGTASDFSSALDDFNNRYDCKLFDCTVDDD